MHCLAAQMHVRREAGDVRVLFEGVALGNFLFADGRRPGARLRVGDERHRRDVVGVVAAGAVFVEDGSDVAREGGFGGAEGGEEEEYDGSAHRDFRYNADGLCEKC